MAKDDYDVIVYRVLVYLYACLKHKIMFEDETFNAAVKKNIDSDEYFVNVICMMQEEGLIRGLAFVKAWGGDVILASDMSEAKITPIGIQHLQENSKMKAVGEMLKATVDLISKLAVIIGLFV